MDNRTSTTNDDTATDLREWCRAVAGEIDHGAEASAAIFHAIRKLADHTDPSTRPILDLIESARRLGRAGWGQMI
jgi:hypothetical protein